MEKRCHVDLAHMPLREYRNSWAKAEWNLVRGKAQVTRSVSEGELPRPYRLRFFLAHTLFALAHDSDFKANAIRMKPWYLKQSDSHV